MQYYRNSNRIRNRRSTNKRRSGYRRARRSYQVAKYRKRGSRARRTFRLYRNPFQQSTFSTSLIYNTNVVLQPAPSALTLLNGAIWGFRANSLIDPDFTSTGHQPMYHDLYSQMFNQYRVTASYIKATIITHSANTATANSSGTTTTQPNYAYRFAIFRDTCFTDPTADIPNDMNNLIEEGGSNIRWRYVSPSLTGSLPSLKFKVIPSIMSNLDARDDSLASLCTGNPQRQCVFGIGIASADNTTDPPNVSVAVRIVYKVTYFDRILSQLQN